MRARIAPVLLGLLALAGCAGEEPPPPLPAEALPVSGFVLPFDEYQLAAPDRVTVEKARSTLAETCMRMRGYEVDIPEIGGSNAVAGTENSRRYGLVDESVATRFGYHFPSDEASEKRSLRQQEWEAGLSEEVRTLLDGENGCSDEAQRELRKDAPVADTGWLADQDFSALEESAKLAPVVAAREAWRTCMAGHGFAYATPEDAIADAKWQLDSPAPSPEEVRAAQVDVGCKQSTGLVRTWYEAETALQRQVVERERTRFDEFEAANQARVANAHRVLGS
ncbi:hypothetical protein [Amycolatopsis magusensis]|uniref:Lipoprotein n=1 Tax=Amycolatopsis magusensis TaxID=882444 RepID=A0ABS4PJX9_9PSEU|nr:hypothetical protein [Amycolatopsis magusensis]MBP2179153.1 hypothetical protein [Amycolatopsis magusensis]